MSTHDLIGLSVILLVILGGVYGLYRITKPVSYSKEAYERRLKKGSGIARGTMNAMMYPLEQLLHPKAVEAVLVKRDMKAGYYDVQQETGEGHDLNLPEMEQTEVSHVTSGRKRAGFLRRFFNAFRLKR